MSTFKKKTYNNSYLESYVQVKCKTYDGFLNEMTTTPSGNNGTHLNKMFKKIRCPKRKICLEDILKPLSEVGDDEKGEKKLIEYAENYAQKFDSLGDRDENIYFTCSFIILAASALTPLFNSLIPQDAKFADLVKLYTSILAVISAVGVGVLQISQAFDRMTLEKVTRIYLEREILMFKTKGGIYSKENNPKLEKADNLDAERRRIFSRRIAEIIVNKFNKYYAISPKSRQEEST